MAEVVFYIDGETGDTHGSTDEFEVDSVPNPDAGKVGQPERLDVPKAISEHSLPNGTDFGWAATQASEAMRSLRQRRPDQAAGTYFKVTIRAKRERASGGGGGGGLLPGGGG